MFKKIALVTALFAVSIPAYADVSLITSAQATLLSYGAALLALGVAVWAAMKVVRLFGGK